MIDVSIKLDPRGVKNAQTYLINALSVKRLIPEANRTKDRILGILRQGTPVGSSGRLRDGWRGVLKSDGTELELSFFNTDPRANRILPILARGSRPHNIRAKVGHILAFTGSRGDSVYRQKVRHPGTRPFIKRTVFEALQAEGWAFRQKALNIAADSRKEFGL